MDNNTYKRAKGYAYKLDHSNYMDNLHDAFLYHWDKKGDNLFEREVPYVLRAVRYMSGWKNQKQFSEVHGSRKERGEKVKRFQSLTDNLVDHKTPDKIYENKEILENLYSKINVYRNRDRMKQVLDLKLLGYTWTEICEETGIPPSVVNRIIEKINEIANESR